MHLRAFWPVVALCGTFLRAPGGWGEPPKEVLLCTLLQIFAPRVAFCLHVLYRRVESCRKFFGDIVEFFGRCDAHRGVYKRCEGRFPEILRD